MRNYTNYILTKKDNILERLDGLSKTMIAYINENKNSKFVFLYKTLSHADLATFGRASKQNALEDNILYYITVDEMKEIEKATGKVFQTTHQSNVGLKKEFYRLVGLPDPRDLTYRLNDYMQVFLVNESIKFFEGEYTEKVISELGKSHQGAEWNFSDGDKDVCLSEDSATTPIEVHIARHGMGIKNDKEFHKLRHHMFKGDSFALLCEEKPDGTKSLFIMLRKNPKFFSIAIGYDKQYIDILEKELEDEDKKAVLAEQNTDVPTFEDGVSKEVTRREQARWRRKLAEEMTVYTADKTIFCPFTYIGGDFKKVGALFVASHIKAFSESSNEEKYDIYNGLLLSANADALFDKYLITVDENRRLVFSYLIRNDEKLKAELRLNQPIFTMMLTPQRMRYLEWHKHKFDEMEKARKLGLITDEDVEDDDEESELTK